MSKSFSMAGMSLAALLLGAAGDPARFAVPPTAPRPAKVTGKVLLADDFSGTLAQWRPDRPEVWSIWRGMLRADLPDEKQARSFAYAGSDDWRDYSLDFDVCAMRGVDKGAAVRVQGESGFAVDLRSGAYQDLVVYVREWPLGRARALNPNGAWNHVRIEAVGDRYRVFVNDDLVFDRSDRRRPQGRIALAAYTGGVGQCTVYYDNVVAARIE